MNTDTHTTNDSRQKVAGRVRSIMAAKSLTLAALADLCGLPASNLSSMINGKRNPTLDTLDRLADALNVPTWHLIADPAELAPAAPDDSATTPPDDTTRADLITVDPQTGEAHRYKLIS